MTENKRFELMPNPQGQVDIVDHVESEEKNAICIYNDLGVLPFSSASSLCDLLNALHEENEQLKQRVNVLDDQITAQGIVIEGYQNRNQKLFNENEQIKQELDYIQNSITEHIKHQKTELGQKALKEVIKDYNEWMIGHKGFKE